LTSGIKHDTLRYDYAILTVEDNKMKKLFTLFLAAAMLLGACAAESPAEDGVSTATPPADETPQETNEPAAPEQDADIDSEPPEATSAQTLAAYGAFKDQTPLVHGIPYENDSIKIEPSMPFVYNAEYPLLDFNVHDADVFAAFPFININSADAEAVNEQIKSIFESNAQLLGEDFIRELGWVEIFIGYDVFYSENLMTLLCYRVGAFTDVPKWSYSPYTFDLATGELLNFEQLCGSVGLTAGEANALAEAKITAIVQNNAERYESHGTWGFCNQCGESEADCSPERRMEADIEISIARFHGAPETYFSYETGVEQELEYYFPLEFFIVDGVLYCFMYVEVNAVHWGYYPKIFSINNDELYAPRTIEKYSYI
jgi:hypothetical protein